MALSVTAGGVDTPPAPAADLAEYLDRARLQGETARALQAGAIDASYTDVSPSRIDRTETEVQAEQGQAGRTDRAKAEPTDTGDGWGDGGR